MYRLRNRQSATPYESKIAAHNGNPPQTRLRVTPHEIEGPIYRVFSQNAYSVFMFLFGCSLQSNLASVVSPHNSDTSEGALFITNVCFGIVNLALVFFFMLDNNISEENKIIFGENSSASKGILAVNPENEAKVFLILNERGTSDINQVLMTSPATSRYTCISTILTCSSGLSLLTGFILKVTSDYSDPKLLLPANCLTFVGFSLYHLQRYLRHTRPTFEIAITLNGRISRNIAVIGEQQQPNEDLEMNYHEVANEAAGAVGPPSM